MNYKLPEPMTGNESLSFDKEFPEPCEDDGETVMIFGGDGDLVVMLMTCAELAEGPGCGKATYSGGSRNCDWQTGSED